MIKKTILMLLVLVGGVMSANADNYLKGNWDNYAEHKFEFSGEVGTVKISNLEAGTDYYFGVQDGNNFFSYREGNNQDYGMTINNSRNWTLYLNNGHTKMTTTIAGDYIFKIRWIGSNPHVWVIYPDQVVVHFYNGDNWDEVGAYRYNNDNNYSSYDKSWPGTKLSKNISNSDYYDLFFNDNFYNIVIFNNNKETGASQIADLSVDYNALEYWVTKSGNSWSISSTAPENWIGYTRTVTSGNLGTICLPFNATVTGATVYQIVGKTVNGSGNLTGIYAEPVTSLVAGHAYLFKATGTSLTATYSGSYSEASEADGMLGNLSSTPLTVTSGYVINGGKIRKLNGGSANIGQYKAYITLKDIDPITNAPGLTFIDCDDNATGIEGLEIENSQDVIYDMQGRQVKDVKKGLFIINGKKVLVK